MRQLIRKELTASNMDTSVDTNGHTDLNDRFVVKYIPGKGRAIFTKHFIGKGQSVMKSPVITMSDQQYSAVGKPLNNYAFWWSHKPSKSTALTLGYGSLFNHHETPNCDYSPDYDTYCMHYTASQDISPGSELTINYGWKPKGYIGDPDPNGTKDGVGIIKGLGSDGVVGDGARNTKNLYQDDLGSPPITSPDNEDITYPGGDGTGEIAKVIRIPTDEIIPVAAQRLTPIMTPEEHQQSSEIYREKYKQALKAGNFNLAKKLRMKMHKHAKMARDVTKNLQPRSLDNNGVPFVDTSGFAEDIKEASTPVSLSTKEQKYKYHSQMANDHAKKAAMQMEHYKNTRSQGKAADSEQAINHQNQAQYHKQMAIAHQRKAQKFHPVMASKNDFRKPLKGVLAKADTHLKAFYRNRGNPELAAKSKAKFHSSMISHYKEVHGDNMPKEVKAKVLRHKSAITRLTE